MAPPRRYTGALPNVQALPSEVGEDRAFLCTQPPLAPSQEAQGSPALRTSKSVATYFKMLFPHFFPNSIYI